MQRLSTTENEAEISLNSSELSMLCNALRQVVDALDASELQFLVGGTAEELQELANEFDMALTDMDVGGRSIDYLDEEDEDEEEEE